MSLSRILRALSVLFLASIGACATEPQHEPPPASTAPDDAVDDDDSIEDDLPPDAQSEDGQDLQTRLAKARFWRALVESPVPPHAVSLSLVDGALLVTAAETLPEEDHRALERLATEYLGAARVPWRMDPEPRVAEPSGWRTAGARAANPPTERRLRQLAALADPDDFERDPRLEYDRDAPAPAHIVRAATGDRPLTYRVRAGDSLSLIAARTMGSGNHWQRIHDLNRHIIGPDPARLMEGMELRIPQD